MVASIISRNFDINGYWGIGVILKEMIANNEISRHVTCPDDKDNEICKYIAKKWGKTCRTDLHSELELGGETKFSIAILRGNILASDNDMCGLCITGKLTVLNIVMATVEYHISARPHNPSNESRSARGMA
jgi:hypothetical protein